MLTLREAEKITRQKEAREILPKQFLDKCLNATLPSMFHTNGSMSAVKKCRRRKARALQPGKWGIYCRLKYYVSFSLIANQGRLSILIPKAIRCQFFLIPMIVLPRTIFRAELMILPALSIILTLNWQEQI